jgi:hypothetical protein
MKVVAWKDINILDKTTYTKRLAPRNDWVVAIKTRINKDSTVFTEVYIG